MPKEVAWPISKVATHLVEVCLVRHGGPDYLRLSASHFQSETFISAKSREVITELCGLGNILLAHTRFQEKT